MMALNGRWSIESYRTSYESSEHWALKRDFMAAYKQRIPEDRLVCLAQVFANIELLGCRYPAKVMQEVAELSKGIGEAFRSRKKNMLKRTFVKASDAAEAKVTRKSFSDLKRKLPIEEAQPQNPSKRQALTKSNYQSRFVAETSSHTPDYSYQQGVNKYQMPVKRTFAANTDDASSRFTEQANTMTVGRGIGLGSNRSLRGRVNLTRTVVFNEERNVQSSRQSNKQMRGQRVRAQQQVRNDGPLSNFVIIMREYKQGTLDPVTILNHSKTLSRMKLYLENEQTYSGTNVHLYLDNTYIATGEGATVKEAREDAHTKALEIMSQSCYTIKIRMKHESAGEVSVSEVPGAEDAEVEDSTPSLQTKVATVDTPIEESSVGSKLLKMMGWSGGGLGKDGSGIAEPIRPAHVFGRQGLGHDGTSGGGKQGGNKRRGPMDTGHLEDFKKSISAIIKNFVHNTIEDDIAFSPEFTKEQRAAIHQLAPRFKLKSKSTGVGDERYLVLSRKFTARQLLDKLLQERGECDKYEVIPPGGAYY